MVIGLVLAGSLVGAGAAAAALLLGHPLWIALLLYPAAGTLSVVAAALVLALRAVPEDRKAPAPTQARIT